MDAEHASIRGGKGLRGRLAVADLACPECGYNLRGSTSVACPECGTVIPMPADDAGGERDEAGTWRRTKAWLQLASVVGLVVGATQVVRVPGAFLRNGLPPMPSMVGGAVCLLPAVTQAWWWFGRAAWLAADRRERRVRLAAAIVGALTPLVGIAIAL